MNVFDFDNTIYAGDSTRDFYLFCLRKNPALIRYLPKQLYALIKYTAGKTDRTYTKEQCYSFLASLRNQDTLIEEFWEQHIQKIRPWYREKQQNTDCIISASPEFLLNPVCRQLGIQHLIASRVDLSTGKYTGQNCSGQEKVTRFQMQYPAGHIEECYFDSDSDIPLARLASVAYRVTGNTIQRWAP